jgi:hypothetical protein
MLLLQLAAAAPPDPFAAEYAPPKSIEVGTAANQLRLLGSAGGLVEQGLGAAAQGTMELMTIPWIGVRGSSLVTIPFTNGPQLLGARLGPSLHLLPYQRVDLGSFFEGGAALVDVTKSSHAWMPVVAGGLTLDLAVTSFLVVHLEGYLQAGIADRGGRADVLFHPVGLLGLGLLL